MENLSVSSIGNESSRDIIKCQVHLDSDLLDEPRLDTLQKSFENVTESYRDLDKLKIELNKSKYSNLEFAYVSPRKIKSKIISKKNY
jgi:hypothetical protein